jgi:hypothetical protein
MALLGTGCVSVVSHVSEYDAGPDGAASDGGDAEAGSPLKCSSGKWWTGDNTPNAGMTPGKACNTNMCHGMGSKMPFALAGTIYSLPGSNDADNCQGVDGVGMAVVAFALDDPTNELGSPGRIPINGAGNFSTNKPLPPEFKVKVIQGGREAVMMAPIVLSRGDGDCNACHSAEGRLMAKGRITPPL